MSKELPLTAEEIWKSWNKTTRMERLNQMINQTAEDVSNLELQIVWDDIIRDCLSKEEIAEGMSDRRKLSIKRASLDTLMKKRKEVMAVRERPKKRRRALTELPDYIRMVITNRKCTVEGKK